ncbi:hypothetical protein K2X30_13935 [bacterium]|jgi:CheY-specific phosphatase CheX|nr:hypothetical protein [bacterium]
MNPKQEDIQKLKRLVRNISKSRLVLHGNRSDVELGEIQGSPWVYAHWMSIILVSGKDVKMIFKAHFMSKDAKLLASVPYKKASSAIRIEQALDFMREFCNLTAGAIKRSLSDAKVMTGVSLPLVTRGFDEVFFQANQVKNNIFDQWRLHGPDFEIGCTVSIETFEQITLTSLNENVDEKPEDLGEAEFL